MTIRPYVRPFASQGHQYEVAYTGYNPLLNPLFLARNLMLIIYTYLAYGEISINQSAFRRREKLWCPDVTQILCSSLRFLREQRSLYCGSAVLFQRFLQIYGLPYFSLLKVTTVCNYMDWMSKMRSDSKLFLRRETSLTGLECEGGGRSFPLVLLNIIFHKKLHLPFTLLGLVYHMDVR